MLHPEETTSRKHNPSNLRCIIGKYDLTAFPPPQPSNHRKVSSPGKSIQLKITRVSGVATL